jgi:hypothetical protein
VAQRLGGCFIPEVSGPGGATLSCTCYGRCSSPGGGFIETAAQPWAPMELPVSHLQLGPPSNKWRENGKDKIEGKNKK